MTRDTTPATPGTTPTGAAERSRRRALAKRHHPDLGGDPAEFDRAMRATAGSAAGSPAGPGTHPRTEHHIVFTPSPRTRLRRRVATTRAIVGTQVLRLARLTRRAP